MRNNPVNPSPACDCPSCGRKVAHPHPQYPFCSESCRRADHAAYRDGAVIGLREPAHLGGDLGASGAPQDWREFIAG